MDKRYDGVREEGCWRTVFESGDVWRLGTARSERVVSEFRETCFQPCLVVSGVIQRSHGVFRRSGVNPSEILQKI